MEKTMEKTMKELCVAVFDSVDGVELLKRLCEKHAITPNLMERKKTRMAFEVGRNQLAMWLFDMADATQQPLLDFSPEDQPMTKAMSTEFFSKRVTDGNI